MSQAFETCKYDCNILPIDLLYAKATRQDASRILKSMSKNERK